MSFIPGAFQAGANAVVGIAGAGTKKISSLAFMKVDTNNGDDDNDNQEENEMNIVSIIIRLVLCPIFVPIFMLYIFCWARGSPIAAELDSLKFDEDNTFDEDEDEDTDIRDKDCVGIIRAIIRWFLCRPPPPKIVTEDPYKLSYENFLVRQQLKEANKKEIVPYKVDVHVSRTDKVVFPFDGVFVKNQFIGLTDIEGLQSALTELEEELIEAHKNSQDLIVADAEQDEWGDVPAIIKLGDSKKLLQTLLKQARQGEELIKSKKNPYTIQKRSGSQADLKNEAPTVILPADSDNSLSPTPAAATVVTPISKNKPKKAPVPAGTPLEERMNFNVAVNVYVEGPSLEHTPSSITNHYKA